MSGKQTQIEDQKSTPAAAAGVVNTGVVVESAKEDAPDSTLVAVRPEWLDDLLRSNEAVILSNTTVVDSVNRFKDLAGGLVKEVVDTVKINAEQNLPVTPVHISLKTNSPVFNPDAEYEVIVPFRDSEDFNKIHKVGDDVTKLGQERIEHLLITGNVEEV